MADKFSGSSKGFGNRTIIDMLEQPPSQHGLVGFPGMNTDSAFIPASFYPASTHADITLSLSNMVATANAHQTTWPPTAVENAIELDTKPYIEFKILSCYNDSIMVGIFDGGSRTYASPNIFYTGYGYTYFPEGVVAGATFTDGDIIGVAYDAPNKTVYFYKNNVFQFSRTTTSTNKFIFGACVTFYDGHPFGSVEIVTDPNKQTYTAPTGFTAGFGVTTGVSATVWDSARKGSNVVLSQDKKTVSLIDVDTRDHIRTEFDAASSGKYYWEIVLNANYNFAFVGVYSLDSIPNGEVLPPASSSGYLGDPLNSIGYYGSDSSGNPGGSYCRNVNGTKDYLQPYGERFSTQGDVIGVALDLDNNVIQFSKNGVWFGELSIASAKYYPGVCNAYNQAATSFIGRFSESELQYSPPNNGKDYALGFGARLGGFITDDSNNINLTGKSIVTKARYNADISFNGTIKVLISFDHRNTWNYWDGDGWVDSSGIDYTNADTIENTMAALEMSRLEAGDTYLDFAIRGFDNGYGDPALNRIDIEVR